MGPSIFPSIETEMFSNIQIIASSLTFYFSFLNLAVLRMFCLCFMLSKLWNVFSPPQLVALVYVKVEFTLFW